MRDRFNPRKTHALRDNPVAERSACIRIDLARLNRCDSLRLFLEKQNLLVTNPFGLRGHMLNLTNYHAQSRVGAPRDGLVAIQCLRIAAAHEKTIADRPYRYAELHFRHTFG